MLTLHENSFLSNPNAVYNAEDYRGQMAAEALLRMLSYYYVERKRRNGPYYLQFTDLHESNIFVDGHCNITCLMDLEWVCDLPIEMLAVPYWLMGHGIDEIVGDNLREFDDIRQEFMKIFEEEEVNIASKQMPVLASIMYEGWESDGIWFWRCLTSTNAMISLVEDHICPRFSRLSSKAEEIFSQYWCQGSAEVVERKVTDYEGYKKELEVLATKLSNMVARLNSRIGFGLLFLSFFSRLLLFLLLLFGLLLLLLPRLSLLLSLIPILPSAVAR